MGATFGAVRGIINIDFFTPHRSSLLQRIHFHPTLLLLSTTKAIQETQVAALSLFFKPSRRRKKAVLFTGFVLWDLIKG